jgi:nonribosomal peptide synthetase DhbF
VSSLSVFTGADDRAITEDSGTAHERHSPGRGYSASKWVADRMIGHAAERGAACRIYRLGRISGATDTGVASLDDMFYRLLISCAALRCYPDDPALDTNLLPVDVAAQALVALALGGDERVVYHLHHRDGTALADFMAVFDRLRGGECEPVPLGEWVDRVRRSGRLPIQPYLPALAELAAAGAGQPAIEYSNEVTRSRLARLGVTIPDINTALIERYWHFLAEAGSLP